MGNDCKYIVYEKSFRSMIVFGQTFTHAEMAERLNVTPISAGFLSIGTNLDGKLVISAYGESTSLKLQSDPRDTVLAKRLFNVED